MKKLVALLLAGIVVTACGCSKNSQTNTSGEAEISVKIAAATEKYTQEADISALPEGTLSIAAAKGETEGGQFIINSETEISEYSISVSDLKNDGHIIDAESINIQTELYSFATQESGKNVLPSGSYPDALISVDYIVEANENKIEAGKNQGFFVDVTVPLDVAAGTYTGEIHMDCDNKKIVIPVEVEVYDFEIASVPYTKTSYLIWQDWLIYGEMDVSDEKYMDYYDMLLKYNICGYTFPHTDAKEFVSYVREYYSKIPCFGIPYDALSTTTNDWEKFNQYLTELAYASVEDGVNYFDKAYYYLDMFYDEYDMIIWRQAVMKTVLETCDQLEEELVTHLVKNNKITNKNDKLAQSILNLKHAIPMTKDFTDSELSEYDITFTPLRDAIITTAALEEFKDITPADEELWTYHIEGTAVSKADKALNGPLLAGRDHFWSNYEHGIVGDLYWCVNGYCQWTKADGLGGYKPLPDLYTTASHDDLSNGDGYLVYPGLPYGSEEPFGSLRLVAIRDGIDDNTYMGMLGDAYKELSKTYKVSVEDAKSFVTFLNKNIVSRQNSKHQHEKLLSSRKSLATAIQLAQKQGVLIEELSVEKNELTYTIYTQADVALAIAGNKISSVQAGEGKCYQGTFDITNVETVDMTFSQGENQMILSLIVSDGDALNDFESEEALTDCTVYSKFGSDVSLNTNSKYAKSGNSAKVTISGYDFGNETHNNQFHPGISFLLDDTGKKISEMESIEMWVYNADSKDTTVQIYLEGVSKSGDKASFTYDTVTLRKNSWNKVVIDNFSYISTEQEVLDQYTSFGINLENQIGSTYTWYVDELFVR